MVFDGTGSLSYQTWKRLRADMLSLASMLFIVSAIIIALLGYLITPDSTPFANSQFPELSVKKPGFSVTMIRVRKNQSEIKTSFLQRMFYGATSDYNYYPAYQGHFDNNYIVIEDYSGDEPNDGNIRKINIADVVYPLKKDDAVIEEKNGNLIFCDINGRNQNVSVAQLKKEIVSNNVEKKIFLFSSSSR